MVKTAQICRFCLYNEKNGTEPTKFLNTNLEGLSKLTKLGIIFNINDSIPLLACISCLDFIDKMIIFLETARNSEKILHEFYNRTKNENLVADTDSLILKNKLVEKSSKYSTIKTVLTSPRSDTSDFVPSNTNTKKNENRSQLNSESPTNDVKTITDELEESKYFCEICAKDFDNFFEYHDHQYSHNGEYVYHCSKCNEVFSTREDLVQHEQLNHVQKVKVTCFHCRLEVLPKSLSAHLNKHTDLFKCSICNSRHSSRATLDKHFKARHAGLKGCVCYICGKQNSCQASMKRHLATHLPYKPFKCVICSFATKSKTVLQVHTLRQHYNEQSTCNICMKTFKSKLSLNQHEKRIHQPKKYICNVCNKLFSEKFNLDQHITKKHCKQRVYECKECKLEFFTVQKLRSHMHSHRSGSIRCQKCGKEFSYKKHWQKHSNKCLTV